MGYFVKNRKFVSGSTSMVVPAGDSADRPEAPVFGSFRYNTEIGTLEFFNGTVFKSVGIAGEVDIVVDSFVGDGSTVTFTMSVEATDAEQVIVFVGSIYQQPTTTYSITGMSNIDITFTSAPPDGESINVIHNLASTVAG
jgi:hypothetical protein